MFRSFITKGTGCTCRQMSSKSGAIVRQARVMEKLFGNRIPGSKKRHWPDAMGIPHGDNRIFKSSPTAGGGKSNTRRMQVLNKLFMENISQLLAEVESVLNRGLQIQRVKISPDFTRVNVYWVGSGDPLADDQLAMELKRQSGILRHEMSQLRLMGEVPRIMFVHDRTLANLAQLDSMLQNINFAEDGEEEVDDATHRNVITTLKKDEFLGQTKTLTELATVNNSLPEMRHDVLGLDQREIMSRILAKMKKSKTAWDAHNLSTDATSSDSDDANLKQLERINIKMAEAAETEPKFEQFLAKRRERKNTPERKKHHRLDELLGDNELNESAYQDAVLSSNRRRLLHEEDFLPDDDVSGRRS